MRFFVSVFVWFVFLSLSTLLVYVTGNVFTTYTVTWENAFGLAVGVRFLFALNNFYAHLEKDLNI